MALAPVLVGHHACIVKRTSSALLRRVACTLTIITEVLQQR